MVVILVDGRNICYKRAWVGRNLHASDGQDTGAVHGVLTGLVALKRRFPTGKFAVVWDGAKAVTSWRNKLFAGYKSNRSEPASEDMKMLRASVSKQIGVLRSLLTTAGVTQIEIDSMEADDVIGILSEKCTARRWETYVFSSDQDFLQLKAYGVRILRATGDRGVTEQEILSKWKCGPKDLLKLRALLGDKSDCIPRAVSGVGPVAAAKYISLGIDPELESFEMMPRSVRAEADRLRSYWPTIHLNYRLMRILRSCNDPELPEELHTQTAVATRRVLKELESKAVKDASRYQEMLELMASMDLSVAIQNRAEIWRLQDVSL